MLYTCSSGFYPRGVVHTFASIEAQVSTVCDAWEWQPEDRLLHVLPISHIHGLVCGLLCTLAAGASCVLLASFKTIDVWEQLASRSCSLLTAVPTIYQYLLDTWERKDHQTQLRWQDGAKQLRLTIVGAAPLPLSTHNQWLALTGQPLVTRYGLTEAGMVLSRHKDDECRHDYLGRPLPGVSIRLVDDSGALVKGVGELEVRSSQMFKEYFGKHDLNRTVFHDDWFRTGDMAIMDNGQYRLLGKRSTDIIETGGVQSVRA